MQNPQHNYTVNTLVSADRYGARDQIPATHCSQYN